MRLCEERGSQCGYTRTERSPKKQTYASKHASVWRPPPKMSVVPLVQRGPPRAKSLWLSKKLFRAFWDGEFNAFRNRRQCNGWWGILDSNPKNFEALMKAKSIYIVEVLVFCWCAVDYLILFDEEL